MHLVERWFSALTSKKLQRSAHRSVQALAQDIRDWVEAWNDNPRPFTWHQRAEETSTDPPATAAPATNSERSNLTGHQGR
jgi:hypothetical protein